MAKLISQEEREAAILITWRIFFGMNGINGKNEESSLNLSTPRSVFRFLSNPTLCPILSSGRLESSLN
jgi:hypothetical protein